jgi:hypothetical protein
MLKEIMDSSDQCEGVADIYPGENPLVAYYNDERSYEDTLFHLADIYN